MAILETDLKDGVAAVTMNRPEAFNALSAELLQALIDTFTRLGNDKSVRCIVLRGAGPAFMAGGDLKLFAERLTLPAPERAEIFTEKIKALEPLIESITAAPQPVIAAVHGAAAGFGVSLAAVCDLIYASTEAYFVMAYVHIGASPDGGSTWLLPRIVGLRRAMELALLGGKLDAVQAERYGLVNGVFSPATFDKDVNRIAARLAAGPLEAQAEIKRLLHLSAQNSLDEQMTAEAAAFAGLTRGGDFAEGVSAFLEKRKPVFGGAD